MPKKVKTIINWYPPRECWRKFMNGKMYYLGCGKCRGEDDVQGREAALQEWFTIKKNLEDGLPARPEKMRFPEPNPIFKEPGRQEPGRQMTGNVYCAFDYGKPREANGNGGATLVSKEWTLDEMVAAYLREHERRIGVGDGKIAHASHREMKECLKHFQDYAKDSVNPPLTHPAKVDLAPLLYEFQQKNLDFAEKHKKSKRKPGVLDKSYGPAAAKRHLAHLKRFILWIYKREAIDTLPRILDKDFAKVAIEKPNPIPLAPADLTAIWKQAITFHLKAKKSYRNALYILLGLNCGYRSVDISTLRHEHLKVIDGRTVIVRKRKKTGETQIHRLWPLTETLLREEMEVSDPTKINNLVLRDERGGELVRDGSGGETKNDSVGSAWRRLSQKLGWTEAGKGHSILRKTSAQLLRDNGYDQTVISQFLGHATKEMSKHYEQASIKSRAKLFDAIDHLYSEYESYGISLSLATPNPATPATPAPITNTLEGLLEAAFIPETSES